MFDRNSIFFTVVLVLIGQWVFRPLVASGRDEQISSEARTNAPVELDPTFLADAQAKPSVEDQPIHFTARRQAAKSTGRTNVTGSWGAAILALAVVLAVIFVAAYLFRRAWPSSQGWRNCPAIEILGRTYLSPKQSLCLVKVGKEITLLGLCADRISALGKIDDPEQIAGIVSRIEQARQTSITNSFSNLFRQNQHHYHGVEQDGEPDGTAEEGLLLQAKTQVAAMMDCVRKLKRSKGMT